MEDPPSGKYSPMMTQDHVLAVMQGLESAGVEVWVDGGWGVDALIGRQTRPHQDLDLALALSDVPRAVAVLGQLGWQMHEAELPTRADLRSADDGRVDLHILTFDEQGNGFQQLQDGSFGTYDKQGLSGIGTIGEMEVRCLSPEIQMRFHAGYEPDDDDRHDGSATCTDIRPKRPEGIRNMREVGPAPSAPRLRFVYGWLC
jgi:lincosamide nucleotidyltransferase A/C/D/E